ncbi:MAG: molybdenum cofactor biosynthesis protein MoaE [Desulfomonilaceae bacterium]
MSKKAEDSIETLIRRVKAHPNISKAGMILCHNGIVRDFSRQDGKKVQSLSVRVDNTAIDQAKAWALAQPGIVAVEILALEGDFVVGDDLLYVVVAGDLRENVFNAMRDLIEKIKTGCVRKNEIIE